MPADRVNRNASVPNHYGDSWRYRGRILLQTLPQRLRAVDDLSSYNAVCDALEQERANLESERQRNILLRRQLQVAQQHCQSLEEDKRRCTEELEELCKQVLEEAGYDSDGQFTFQ